ncbi:MAG TPA: exodeoxyribonuclease III [Steroidobacteraceae bacterium]|jgi:exodeoxyribonuclease-3|nr:exodeoxyribonuclease III [Steroidobacteraceae bacterium]
MRITTWNVNSLRVRMEHLSRWLADHAVDAMALQELKLADEHFPHAEIEALGLHAICYGQKTYNGVAILSRSEATECAMGVPGDGDPQRRVIAASVGPVRLVNVYVPNGQAVGSEKYTYKLAWLERLRGYLASLLEAHEHLLVVGDFNIAPEDRDVHDPAAWEGSVHVSAPEREALAKIGSLGLVDLFRRFEQPKNSWSWWDYRMNSFRRDHGLRIDLMLASKSLAARCTACTIDRTPRTWERPSDHAPVTAEFDIG